MTCSHDVFLSYSHSDREVAINLRGQLDRHGLSVFRDEDKIREGELWLTRLQEEVSGCGSFVVLIGRNGVGRWIGAETQVALLRHFSPHDDAQRLTIYPILLGDARPETLPAFLQLFQATRWDGTGPLPVSLVDQIRDRVLVTDGTVVFKSCPFVGLDAFGKHQARLFFGRQKETLDALTCFDTRSGGQRICWLEINGSSGCGKSSLMSAGLLPLVEEGWLWPRTGIEQWRVIGPMMPGEHPVMMLAEHLARAFNEEMADVLVQLEDRRVERPLALWLRTRKRDDAAFLLAIDQFEELFTFADPDERAHFDCLLAGALEDPDCPLFVISTVRADFLDRFEDLRRLVALRNRSCRPWTLAPIGEESLREVIAGPSRLADLDASEVQEAMLAEARDEPGALPLIENALQWLWEQPRTGNRLSGPLFTQQGGLAGILSRTADDLLKDLGKQRERALELLFRLVQVDPEGRRHTRRRISLTDAVAVAGGGKGGSALVGRLAGERPPETPRGHGQLRLITITQEVANENASKEDGRWVNLIHETLIRSKGTDSSGRPRPFWPTLWNYVEQNKRRAARRERLRLLARQWQDRTGVARLFGLVGWTGIMGFRGLAAPNSVERRYVRWSIASATVQTVLLVGILGVIGESGYWMAAHGYPLDALEARWAYKLALADLPLPKLREVPAGTYMMGDDESEQQDEKPAHSVALAQPLYVATTEVTFVQFDAFAIATGHRLPDDSGWGRAMRPVANVSWSEASAYASWLAEVKGNRCRLLSEAEWELPAVPAR